MNSDQSKMVVSSQDDAIFIDISSQKELDLDEEYGLQKIKDIEYDEEDKVFYVSSNMYKNNLGVYILRIYENDLNIKSEVLQWHTRLEIGDVDLNIMWNNELGLKELVLGYR